MRINFTYQLTLSLHFIIFERREGQSNTKENK